MGDLALAYFKRCLTNAAWAVSPLWSDGGCEWNEDFVSDFVDACKHSFSDATKVDLDNNEELKKKKYGLDISKPVVWMDVEGLRKYTPEVIMFDEYLNGFIMSMGLKIVIIRKMPFIGKCKED